MFDCLVPGVVLSSSRVSFSTVVDPKDSSPSFLDMASFCSVLRGTWPNALAKTSSSFLPRLPTLPLPGDDGRCRSWGLCLAMLDFVGEAKEGLCSMGLVTSRWMGIRLGVAVASTDTDIWGEILRRLGGDGSIARDVDGFYQSAIFWMCDLASENPQSSLGRYRKGREEVFVWVAYVGRDFEGPRLHDGRGSVRRSATFRSYLHCMIYLHGADSISQTPPVPPMISR